MTKTTETEMKNPITLTYDFKIGGEWIRKTYTAKTYEDWHRIVRIIHENEDHYKAVKVERVRRTVIEVCPECGAENEIVWDVETMGYEAYCPVCGAQMLLCDECIHAEDGLNENCSNCNWHKDKDGRSICFRCKNMEE